jgi:hypothetical protein
VVSYAKKLTYLGCRIQAVNIHSHGSLLSFHALIAWLLVDLALPTPHWLAYAAPLDEQQGAAMQTVIRPLRCVYFSGSVAVPAGHLVDFSLARRLGLISHESPGW